MITHPARPHARHSLAAARRGRMARRAVVGLSAIALALGLGGCKSNRTTGGAEPLSPEQVLLPPTPTYANLAAAHNERVGKIGDFWSRASLRAEWIDDEGERHREEGEGHLILRMPYQTSLTIGKVGEIGYWAGSDAEHFWMFDSVDKDNRIAFLGRNENAFSGCAEPLPLAVHPLEMIDLLGLFTLPPALPIQLGAPESSGSAGGTPAPEAPKVTVEADDRAWVVVIPGPFSTRRISFDADHPDWLPKRVELLDARDGQVLAVAELTEYTRLDALGLSPQSQPWVPTRLYVTAGPNVDPETNFVRLTLPGPADRPESRREIDPRVFEFRSLDRQMRPAEVRILDAACPEPADLATVTAENAGG